MRVASLLSLILLAAALVAHADQVTITNGDRLSGLIMKADDMTLIMKTDYAGEVKLDWLQVAAIRCDRPLHVTLKNGRTFTGPVTTSDGRLQIGTALAAPVEAAKSDIASLRSESEQAVYEKTLHPGVLEEWNGGATVAFALTHGNSQTKNLALAFTAARKTLNDKLGLYAQTVYASNDAPGAVPSTTANAIQAGARYDHDLTARIFAFVTADFQTDALQGLNLRSVPGAGLGFHLLKSSATTLDFLAGINYTRENYTTFTRNFPAASFGEELMHKMRGSTVIAQKLDIYPDLSDLGEYRGTFNLGTVTKIGKWLGWQNAFGDIYVTNPPLGKKQNDVLLTTGLSFSFGTATSQ
ncbi:MAG: DUF481 domain-containing protein [Acidobacteria bacterium]|nr:DUF481 domain-containing protein [Acidobacteriota bacterium]